MTGRAIAMVLSRTPPKLLNRINHLPLPHASCFRRLPDNRFGGAADITLALIMASAHEIAADVLKTFGPNVVARKPPMTYGQYAQAVGRTSRDYGIAVGKAMHAIGAFCVVRQVPVAPLYWVARADDGHRGIFEHDPVEKHYVIDSGDIDVMYVVSREHRYTSEEFYGIERALRKSLASGTISNWSPHQIWRVTFTQCPKDSSKTYYELAMNHYREIFARLKSERGARK